ncbi:nuclease [Endozoicomonas sp. OPT23]|uniref:LabA-like NYN domain-containing protein n=1 Tax=Endozoicomonas sp. OPT23 TaxID=2072845 RepID=UPI00129A92A7|nr:NYN domain-containing protein [Endozoicomonas sp. OPT23]MRI32018.1 nuclease [Endozoicomonas sp. OPT23]
MSQQEEQRVTLLVDVQNIYYTTKQIHRCNFDFNIFWAKATAGRKVVKAIAYAIDRGDPKQRQFQNILRAIGFEVKLKPYIQRSDGSAKGDWDVGIALDGMEYAPKSDAVVLASGDGDFDMLVDRMRNAYDVDVDVYGVRELTAASLINAATRYIPIEGDLLLKKQ